MNRVLPSMVLALVTTGCVQSVNPLHTGATEIDSMLAGTWLGEDGAILVFALRDSSYYALTSVGPDGETSQWRAWLTTIGGRRWIDVRPAALPRGLSDDYQDAFLPLYYLGVVLESGDRLHFGAIDYDTLAAELRRRPDALAHVRAVDNRVILTATTADLRAFLEVFAARPGAVEALDEALVRAAPAR